MLTCFLIANFQTLSVLNPFEVVQTSLALVQFEQCLVAMQA